MPHSGGVDDEVLLGVDEARQLIADTTQRVEHIVFAGYAWAGNVEDSVTTIGHIVRLSFTVWIAILYNIHYGHIVRPEKRPNAENTRSADRRDGAEGLRVVDHWSNSPVRGHESGG